MPGAAAPEKSDKREAAQASMPSLAAVVRTYLSEYFATHRDALPEGRLHQTVIEQAEKPLLALVMKQTRYNQSEAAVLLGINRNTLHKKLSHYGLLHMEEGYRQRRRVSPHRRRLHGHPEDTSQANVTGKKQAPVS